MVLTDTQANELAQWFRIVTAPANNYILSSWKHLSGQQAGKNPTGKNDSQPSKAIVPAVPRPPKSGGKKSSAQRKDNG